MTLNALGYMVSILCVLLAVGALAQVVIWAGAIVFRLRRDPFGRTRDYTPPVTIIKPVRGLAPGDEENFASFFAIQYPAFEILFVVHEDAGDDPAIPVILRLIAEHPGVDARLIRARQRTAVHEKVNNYDEAIRHARYGVINITDADTYVGPAHLAHEVLPLSDPGVGMVFSVQTMTHCSSAAVAFESLVQSGDHAMFLGFTGALGLPRWVVGHSIVFRKAEYLSLDAFSILKDHVIDDVGWGEVMCERGGKRMHLSHRVTHTRASTAGWGSVLRHVIRFSRIFYTASPVYVGVWLLQNSSVGLITLILSLLIPAEAAAPLLGGSLRTLGISLGAGSMVWRTLSNILAVLMYSDTPSDLRFFWTIPLRDLFSLYLGLSTPFMRGFSHAGREYRIKGRRLQRVDPLENPTREQKAAQ
jgi:ceramide glucosyltransferase